MVSFVSLFFFHWRGLSIKPEPPQYPPFFILIGVFGAWQLQLRRGSIGVLLYFIVIDSGIIVYAFHSSASCLSIRNENTISMLSYTTEGIINTINSHESYFHPECGLALLNVAYEFQDHPQQPQDKESRLEKCPSTECMFDSST